MTRDRRFKHRVRRRMDQTGESYTTALAAEQATRPPPRDGSPAAHPSKKKERSVAKTNPAAVTRMRGVWLGVSDLERSREFYELLGAYFDENQPHESIRYATLAGA